MPVREARFGRGFPPGSSPTGLDGASGTELRALMGRSIEATSGGVGKRVFRRGAAAAARATVRAPVELLDIASVKEVLRVREPPHQIAPTSDFLEDAPMQEALEKWRTAVGNGNAVLIRNLPRSSCSG